MAARLLTLTAAGGRRTLQPRLWRPLSSKAGKPSSHLFEIDLNPLQTPIPITETLTLDDAKRASTLQQADAQNEINHLHNEMLKLFGEQVAEYGGDGSSSSAKDAVATFENVPSSRESGIALFNEDSISVGAAVVTEQSEQSPMLATKAVRADVKSKKKQNFSGEKNMGNSSDNLPVNVLLLQGPCSFVRGVWTGGDVEKEELWQWIQALADDLKVVVRGHHYDSEKMVLEKILEAREDEVIVLCWNISLSKSPFIVHALELIQSNVIVVSPSNVEHGPLPANVIGVLSGFRDQSLSLALNAAANLSGPDVNERQKPCEFSDTMSVRGSLRSASAKKAHASSAKAKKSVRTCYLCGKEGHIRSKCPDLPRNRMQLAERE